MTNTPGNTNFTYEGSAEYSIDVRGRLNPRYADRLGSMTIKECIQKQDYEVTTLVGHLRDQAELNGVLNTLYGLHLSILSVTALRNAPGPDA